MLGPDSPTEICDVLREKMKRIGTIAVIVWCLVLASLVAHGAWSHYTVETVPSYKGTDTPRLHSLMLISEGRNALLAVGALLASIFIARSTRRAPSIILTVVAGFAVLLWGASFITALRYTDRTFFALRPWSSTHFVLFWHAFLEPGVRWLLAGVGFACGIMAITRMKRNPDADRDRDAPCGAPLPHH
jgi:hypothetical protein